MCHANRKNPPMELPVLRQGLPHVDTLIVRYIFFGEKQQIVAVL